MDAWLAPQMGPFCEEGNQMIQTTEIKRILQYLSSIPWTIKVNGEDFPDRRFRTIGHHDNPVAEKHHFIYIMRNQHGLSLIHI